MRRSTLIVLFSLSVSSLLVACSNYVPLWGGVTVGNRIVVTPCEASLEFELPLGTRQRNEVAICSCNAWYVNGDLQVGFFQGLGEFPRQVCRRSDRVAKVEYGDHSGYQYECPDQDGRTRIELEIWGSFGILRAWATFSSQKAEKQARDFLETIRIGNAA